MRVTQAGNNPIGNHEAREPRFSRLIGICSKKNDPLSFSGSFAEFVHPVGDSNPCCQNENLES